MHFSTDPVFQIAQLGFGVAPAPRNSGIRRCGPMPGSWVRDYVACRSTDLLDLYNRDKNLNGAVGHRAVKSCAVLE